MISPHTRPLNHSFASSLASSAPIHSGPADSGTLEPMPASRHRRHAILRYLPGLLLLAVAAAFFAFHFLHLTADFPNNSPWMDWAKYTDEGWYGDAAIRHYLTGHWYWSGDFNPAVALPVWPALELIVFKFTGVSPVAARSLTLCVFGLTLVAFYVLLQRAARTLHPRSTPLAGPLCVLFLCLSPYIFVFERMAILEPLLIALAALALIVASQLEPLSLRSLRSSPPRNTLRALALTLALAILIPGHGPHEDHRSVPHAGGLLHGVGAFRLRHPPVPPSGHSAPLSASHSGSLTSSPSSILTTSRTTAISSPPTPTPASSSSPRHRRPQRHRRRHVDGPVIYPVFFAVLALGSSGVRASLRSRSSPRCCCGSAATSPSSSTTTICSRVITSSSRFPSRPSLRSASIVSARHAAASKPSSSQHSLPPSRSPSPSPMRSCSSTSFAIPPTSSKPPPRPSSASSTPTPRTRT